MRDKEIARARSEIPNFSALEEKFDVRQADLEGKHARLERELAKTKERLSKARVDQSIANYTLAELEKQVKASSEASISMEFESRHSHFQMEAAHPAAAKALKEWVAQIINGQQDGTIWLPGPAGNA
jgi:hypothetical protein